jgi:hypothetical protein
MFKLNFDHGLKIVKIPTKNKIVYQFIDNSLDEIQETVEAFKKWHRENKTTYSIQELPKLGIVPAQRLRSFARSVEFKSLVKFKKVGKRLKIVSSKEQLKAIYDEYVNNAVSKIRGYQQTFI